jgi:aspartate racemase
MTLVELLSTLRSRDINVWADGERLRYTCPSGALTPDLRVELAKHKPELITFLNETDRVRRVSRTPISRVSREGKLLPSLNQKRLWYIDQLQPNTAFNCYRAFRIKGSPNMAALEQSLTEIVRRHEALRTTFAAIDGEPFQVINPALESRITLIDLRDILDATKREIETERIITEEVERPFDLAKDPLLRARLLCLGADDHLLLLTLHHIVTDGWSMGILLKELTVLYEAFCNEHPSPLPELPVQYVDFAHWQSHWLHGEVLQQELSYWTDRLKDAPEVTELPTDYPRPAVQNFQGASESLVISKSLTQALKMLNKNQGVTLFMTLLAAFKTLLYRHTRQENLILGSPIAGRMQGDIENLIGLFINTLVLRTNLSGNPTFLELLRRVREVALDAYAHQEVPFEKLIENLRLERSLSFTPLFQVMFVLQNAPESELRLFGSTVSPVAIKRETTLFDLFLSLAEKDEGLDGTLSYRTDLFHGVTINRMIGRFQVLLEGIVADPDRPISTLPLLTEAEKHQLLVEWNDTARDYPKDKCLHQLFEEQAERTPDAVAVIFRNQELTYQELNRRANQVAHYLRRLGVEPDTLVGICVERSLEMVVGLLGILKAGGAYVPLDPQYPKQRLAFFLDDAQVSVLLTQQRLVTDLPEHGARVVCLDVDAETIWTQSAENPVSGVTAANLAYVIYTSGSTGKPKGVMISHHGLCNRLLWGHEAYGLTDSDRCLQVLSLSFDFATWEIFTALVAGAQLIMAKPGGHQDSNYLVKLIRGSAITLVGFVPSMLKAILEESEIESCNSLKRVVCGGEEIPVELQERLFGTLQNVELQNTYGPTEASIDVTCWVCRPENGSGSNRERVPMGRPIANAQIYILDSHLQPVPVGVQGELHIGGVGLARGYLNLRDVTAEKFIPNPFSNEPGARLYKTGDLARYLPDGNIEFLGRLDHQVKVRGFRIEPGEIEAVLRQHDGVREAIVLARKKASGDKLLVAYVVPVKENACTSGEFQTFLKQKLPAYMVPPAFVFLNSLPLTPTGKVDYHALPDPRGQDVRAHQQYVAPRDETERVLCRVWCEVLGIDRVGLDDDFFAIGGHSLLAAKLFARLDEEFGRSLPLGILFSSPTVRALAEHYRVSNKTGKASTLVALSSAGSLPPVYAVPGVYGNVVAFADLSRELGSEQPFYGMQSVGLDGAQAPLESIEEMANRYIGDLQTIQSHGPYALLGACFGATVAYEMARRLLERGEEVAFLGLLDPTRYEGNGTERNHTAPQFIQRAMALSSLITDRLRLYQEEMRRLDIKDRLKFIARKLRSFGNSLGKDNGFKGFERELHQIEVYRANILALDRYHRKRLGGGLRALEIFETARFRNSRVREKVDWNALWEGQVIRHLLPGKDSGDMVSSGNARVLATLLAERLRAAFLKESA